MWPRLPTSFGNLLPECYRAPTEIRERRRTLRYRNLLVRQAVQLKNKTAGLLMETGVAYNKKKLHQGGYFTEFLATNEEISESLRPLLRLNRGMLVGLEKVEHGLLRSLEVAISIFALLLRWDEKAGRRTGCVKLPGSALEVQRRRPAMKKRNTVQQSPKRTPKGPARRSLTIGMDLGDKSSRWCWLDEEGAVVEEGSVATTKKGDAENLRRTTTVPHCHGGGDAFTVGQPVAEPAGVRGDCGQCPSSAVDQPEQQQRRPDGRAHFGATSGPRIVDTLYAVVVDDKLMLHVRDGARPGEKVIVLPGVLNAETAFQLRDPFARTSPVRSSLT